MAICTKCKKDKAPESFCKCKGAKSGFRSICKQCDKEYRVDNKLSIRERNLKYKKNNNIAIKENRKEYYSKNKEAINRKCKEYLKTEKGKETLKKSALKQRAKDPYKRSATIAVNNAIKSKNNTLLKPDSCSDCNKKCSPQAHHWSYKKEHWLNVAWLCHQCHVDLHQNLNKAVSI